MENELYLGGIGRGVGIEDDQIVCINESSRISKNIVRKYYSFMIGS